MAAIDDLVSRGAGKAMTRVRIVGGGLGGVIAAFEAHRLGYRDIELHERSGRLGGKALPRVDHGVEIRDIDLRFAAANDPVRDLLAWHGVAFDTVAAGCGSVSPAPDGGGVFIEDFDGPAVPCRGLALDEPAGETLADRIRAYPVQLQPMLSRYAQWRVGDWIDEAHASAAEVLGMARVYPVGADVSTLGDLRRTDRLYDALYAAPPPLGGRPAAAAALPRDGFAAMFETCRRRLEALDVVIRDTSLVSPQEALQTCGPEDVVVWTADAAPLYRAAGVPAPRPARRLRAAYVFKAEFGRPAPFHIANFTATGVVARIFTYQSRGQTLLCAECVAESPDGDLRREIQRLAAGFGGEALVLRDQVAASVRSAETPTLDGVRARRALEREVERLTGGALILATRRPGEAVVDHAALSAALACALEGEAQAAPAARRA
jgi:hypothetical protein